MTDLDKQVRKEAKKLQKVGHLGYHQNCEACCTVGYARVKGIIK